MFVSAMIQDNNRNGVSRFDVSAAGAHLQSMQLDTTFSLPSQPATTSITVSLDANFGPEARAQKKAALLATGPTFDQWSYPLRDAVGAMNNASLAA